MSKGREFKRMSELAALIEREHPGWAHPRFILKEIDGFQLTFEDINNARSAEELSHVLARVKEVTQEENCEDGAGHWMTCSGCHESEDGHDVGFYPFSVEFNCKLGSGCSECGGIGAVWDTTDYAAYGRELSHPPAEAATASLWPPALSPALAEVLGMQIFATAPIARLFRSTGSDIARKVEAEQAFVLHWLSGLALEHGEGWQKIAGAQIQDMLAKVKESGGVLI